VAALAIIVAAEVCILRWPWTAIPWGVASMAIITRWIRRSTSTKPGAVRIAHLVDAASSGRWQFPYEDKKGS
jgi:hypothetical protein